MNFKVQLTFIFLFLFTFYQDKAFAEDDMRGTLGIEVKPIANATLYGTAITLAWPTTNNFYLGMCFDGADGTTENKYGYTLPEGDQLSIANLCVGALMAYRIAHTQKTAFFVSVQGRVDAYWLGWPTFMSYANAPVYRIVSTNAMLSVAPGIEFSTHHLFFSAYYNFVASGDTNFGQLADFQGPQFSFDYYYKNRRGHNRSLYGQTRSRYRHRSGYWY